MYKCTCIYSKRKLGSVFDPFCCVMSVTKRNDANAVRVPTGCEDLFFIKNITADLTAKLFQNVPLNLNKRTITQCTIKPFNILHLERKSVSSKLPFITVCTCIYACFINLKWRNKICLDQ